MRTHRLNVRAMGVLVLLGIGSQAIAQSGISGQGGPTASASLWNRYGVAVDAAVGSLSIASISPSSAIVGGAAFTLTVSGTGFTPIGEGPIPGSVVQWNGTPLPTSFVSNTQLTAQVPAGDLVSTGTAQVIVTNGAAATSNALPFTIGPIVYNAYTGCNGQPATGILQLWLTSLNTITGAVQINGVDPRPGNAPFSWNWGDSATIQGYFPQSHTYSNRQINYSLQVTSHENDGSTDCAQLGIIFNAQAAASITSVTTANGGAAIAQNDFIVIKGANLVPANTPANGAIWSTAPSFASGLMPTQLGGVSVTVNNKPAFVYFYCSAATDPACSQDQLNILTPLDNTVGPVPVVVTSGAVSTAPFTANLQPVAPAILLASTAGYVVATHADSSPVGPTSLHPGSSTPAVPGETIALYAVGFGLPTTTLVNGSASQSGPLPVLPVCQLGGSAATVPYAALFSPGLYQVNLTIPATAVNGDNALSCTYNGVTLPAGDLIAVQSTIVNPTLTITTPGAGSGTVSSSPAGTSCGSGCLTFAAGTVVTLTAAPNNGSTFAGWSGACTGTGGCVVTMSSSQAVTATFNLNGAIETTAQYITAATGGTISLPGGSSVTFPPGALSADRVVTVSLLPALPKQPPSGTIVGVGPALALSFAPAQSAAMGGNPSFQSHSIAAATSSTDTVIHIVPPNGQLPATVLGSAPVGDFADATGGDNFTGLAGGVDPSGNTATFSASSLIVQGAQALNVSLANLSPGAFLPTYGPRVWNGSQWLPFPQGFDASKKTLVLTHGVLSSVESAYGGCVNSIEAAGGYEQVIGFDYDWTQPIDSGGVQLGAFLNQLQGQGVPAVDLEAHSFGTTVAMDAASMTSLRIGNMILEGGPLEGTPPASHEYLVTALAYISGTASESTIEDVLGSGMMMDVQTGSFVLSRIKLDLLAVPNPPKIIKVVGTQSFFPGESAIVFNGQPNDGLIPVSSASGFDLPGSTFLYPDLTHRDLECNGAVIQDVGAAVRSFPPSNFTLSVVKAGTGGGTVTANPPGLSYAGGTVVTLTATPDSQSTFAGWGSASGVCSGPGTTCSFTVTADDIITATFNSTFTLTVAYAGTGTGAVTANPSGPIYASGTVVTLTASPSSGSTFAGWSGACGGTGGCSVTMSSNQTVTATFNSTPRTFTLTVGYAGTGTGGVSSNPPGPTYASGTVVSLAASPGSGSTFAGWSGACSGTGGCTVTMNANLSVIATFNLTSTGNGSLTGTWTGNFTENAGGCPFAGTMTWSLTETGATLTGTVAFSGTIQSTDPQIVNVCGSTTSGTDTLIPPSSVSGNAVSLTGSVGETFTATVSGTTIMGTSLYKGPNYNITWNYTLSKK
jgi:uncharacterized protein (TIGR03437 family)